MPCSLIPSDPPQDEVVQGRASHVSPQKLKGLVSMKIRLDPFFQQQHSFSNGTTSPLNETEPGQKKKERKEGV